jgi:CRISPR/Cas system-associated exonuclease Cas4 (RecB family)
VWFQKKVLPLQANNCTTMSLTQIIGNVFKPRQKALEKHLNGGEALQRAVLNHLIHTAKDTEYGRNHAFDNIKDYEQFVKMVSVNTCAQGDCPRVH